VPCYTHNKLYHLVAPHFGWSIFIATLAA